MQTSDPIWQERYEGIVGALDVFFLDDVMYEVACELNGKCDNDQLSFKAYLSRWMAASTQLAPTLTNATAIIMNYLQKSAIGAAAQCSGGASLETCGLKWIDNSTYDGTYGPGQQMAAMSVFAANLIASAAAPLTNSTGGTSQGNAAAGTSTTTTTATLGTLSAVTTGERVGAGFLTTVVLLTIVAGGGWMAL